MGQRVEGVVVVDVFCSAHADLEMKVLDRHRIVPEVSRSYRAHVEKA